VARCTCRLAFNPSHLEIVNPVVEGSVRARMDRRGDHEGSQVLPVLVHGDAAFGGQGVNQETLALAQTRGYTTGGTVHIIINNQIGFTTSDPRDMRSQRVLHRHRRRWSKRRCCTSTATTRKPWCWRRSWRWSTAWSSSKDVVVDIICFRKLGHNEQDTPGLTQPLMYKKIAPAPRHPQAVRRQARLRKAWVTTLGDDMVKAYRAAHGRGQAHAWTRC